MRPEPDFEQNEPLLDAALRDNCWQTASAAVKARALEAFHTRQRVRRLTRWGGTVAVLFATGILAHRLATTARVAPKMAPVPLQASKPATRRGELTDEQLLASFPKGTCFLAEVDGRKELVFYNRDTERAYVAQNARRTTPSASPSLSGTSQPVSENAP